MLFYWFPFAHVAELKIKHASILLVRYNKPNNLKSFFHFTNWVEFSSIMITIFSVLIEVLWLSSFSLI